MALSGRRPHPWKAAAGFHLGWIARPRKVSKDSPSASDQGQAGSGPAQRSGRRGSSYARPSYVTTSEAAGCRCIARGPSSLFLAAFFHRSPHRRASPAECARCLYFSHSPFDEKCPNIHDVNHDQNILGYNSFVMRLFCSKNSSGPPSYLPPRLFAE